MQRWCRLCLGAIFANVQLGILTLLPSTPPAPQPPAQPPQRTSATVPSPTAGTPTTPPTRRTIPAQAPSQPAPLPAATQVQATPAQAAPRLPWYQAIWNVEHTVQTCVPTRPIESPEAYIRMLEIQDRPYRMDDVEEGGVVVQTTLHGLYDVDGRPLTYTWYRGQARCEAAKRAAGQREQDREQAIQRKYR